MKKWWVGVLTLVLCLSACAQTAEEAEPTASVPSMPPPTPEITEAPKELPVYSDPITAFFDTLVYDEAMAVRPFGASFPGRRPTPGRRRPGIFLLI